MTDIITYTKCSICKMRVQEEWIPFHNCSDDETLNEIEKKLQQELDKNLKLKIKNLELKKSISSIKAEIKSSFDQMKSIVEGYHKKLNKPSEINDKENSKEVESAAANK
jgi:membrane-associated HD superfamily phosphohydrolase